MEEEISIGTKAKPKPKTATTAPGSVSATWKALAKCESGGNWSINSGNGYYGGLQFSASSWAGAGGTKYAALPHQATPAEQVATAEKLRARRRLGPLAGLLEQAGPALGTNARHALGRTPATAQTRMTDGPRAIAGPIGLSRQCPAPGAFRGPPVRPGRCLN